MTVIINFLNAASDTGDYTICPGWGHKCISVTKQTFLGPITVPVLTKGKDKPAIELKEK